ncbi:MAG: YggS family pyridoxal phosphate-dependent enzyme [Gluconacetobacter diazotrophicus]|nr:YggS family pyridoxal phosphate-dependent enzyme [Gluconacetobacter diazotrophicus]
MDPTVAAPSSIAERLLAVRARMAEACRRAGRDPDAVSLVAVSKFHPAVSVRAALAAGQHRFGENRVQEAAGKFPDLRRDRPELLLHLIGPLQTNKAADAVAVADAIETLDRPRLADALDRAAQRAGRLPRLLVQVNVGNEPQKAGVAPAEADRFIAACRVRFGEAVTGLMAIPPAAPPPGPFFRQLAALAREHGLHELSMGMSGDFEEAIAWGATSVRIGSAIFGDRPMTPGTGGPTGDGSTGDPGGALA